MIKNVIPSILLAVFIVSCSSNEIKLDDYYTEITNKELKDAIKDYNNSVAKQEATEPYILHVNSRSVGDTLICYYIMYIHSPAMWDVLPILYVANVDGKDVIFSSRATGSPNNVVRLNREIEKELVRRNFPSIYDQYISGKPYNSIELTGGHSCQLFYYKGNLVLKKLYSRDIPISLVAKLIADKKIQVDEDGVKYNIDIDKYFEYWK